MLKWKEKPLTKWKVVQNGPEATRTPIPSRKTQWNIHPKACTILQPRPRYQFAAAELLVLGNIRVLWKHLGNLHVLTLKIVLRGLNPSVSWRCPCVSGCWVCCPLMERLEMSQIRAVFFTSATVCDSWLVLPYGSVFPDPRIKNSELPSPNAPM